MPDARQMAVSRNKATVWVGTRKSTVWSVTDRDMDNVADTVDEFSPSVKFDEPAGTCYSPDGFLFVVERNRVMMFPAAEYFMESPDTVAVADRQAGRADSARGGVVQPQRARVHDRARTTGIYITLGQPFNVTPSDKIDLYRKWGIGGIVSLRP